MTFSKTVTSDKKPLKSKVDNQQEETTAPRIFALDIGLASLPLSLTAGQVLEFSTVDDTETMVENVVVAKQVLPDGLDIDPASNRLFWTSMGMPGAPDGAIYSSSLNGSDLQTVISPRNMDVNTPKQLAVEPMSKMIYFSDREGLRVMRCNFDGDNLETLVQTGDWKVDTERNDATRWCVGVTVAPKLGRIYWTQKGPSKAGQGRIFTAGIDIPPVETPSTRTDVVCLLNHLPEAIDLEVDEEGGKLYWTDRGELPLGNSLNAVQLGADGLLLEKDLEMPKDFMAMLAKMSKNVLARNLHEAIGLKLDRKNRHVYVTDLGGALYRFDLDGGNRTRLFDDSGRSLTGIAIL